MPQLQISHPPLMNVLFHLATAICITSLVTDTARLQQSKSFVPVLVTGALAFTAALISHAALDYVPHCYPVNSKLDVMIALMVILIATGLTNKHYRLITGLSFLGSIFPDLVDLSPGILNKLFGLNLPTFAKLFPWHWNEHSGSVYSGNCNVSTLNHALLLLVVFIILWSRRRDTGVIFSRGV